MKADLYTTLVHAKQVLGGGQPTLTPLTGAALVHVDPEFCPGMGILDENTEGLRCPLRGCGKRFNNLSLHLRQHDHELGGNAGAQVRRLLSLDPRASLASKGLRSRLTDINARPKSPSGRGARAANRDYDPVADAHELSDGAKRSTRERRRRARKLAVGVRNLTNSCDAQITQRVLAVRDRVRREPCEMEATHYDPDLIGAVRQLGWTWNETLAWTRLSSGTSADKLGDVLTLIASWLRENGRLPDRMDAIERDLAPPLPSKDVVLRALGAETWIAAMRMASSLLGLTSGRYVA